MNQTTKAPATSSDDNPLQEVEYANLSGLLEGFGLAEFTDWDGLSGNVKLSEVTLLTIIQAATDRIIEVDGLDAYVCKGRLAEAIALLCEVHKSESEYKARAQEKAEKLRTEAIQGASLI